MRIALASALVFAALTLAYPAAAEDSEASAKAAYAKGDYATALGLWRKAAQTGDAKAQVNLGRLHALGHGVPKDAVIAISWFRKAAEQGSAVAHHNLGVMYETGPFPNLEAAARHYRIAAEDDWTAAQTALAKLYQDGRGVPRDLEKAAKWLEEAADDDDPEAQFLLGVFYANGWGVEQDYSEMLDWTRRSAHQGHPKALFHMGLAYEKGLGISRNPAYAARFYEVAVKKGNSKAETRLGEMYFRGYGVKRDYAHALALLTKAAAAGQATARYILGHAYHTGEGVERNPERGIAYFRRAAEDGHLGAVFRLAKAHETGDGIREDPKKAVELYRRVAEAGDPSAKYALGRVYRAGRGVSKDDAEAVRWFLKAAAGGHDGAQLALARMYRDGIGIGRNDRAALRWINEAVRLGNIEAKAELAEAYLAGRGVGRDPARALELLDEAAEKGLKPARIRIADLLAEGRFVPADPARAAEWYRRLAEDGDPHGTAMLAAFHLEGRGGITQDDARAAELFRIAANLGSAHAADMLAALHSEGRGVEKSHAEAAKWYKIAAAKGDYAANYALGGMYRHGLGVASDAKAAERHYAAALAIKEKSAGRGSLETVAVLRRLAELSHHLGRNERAAAFYRRAAAIFGDAPGHEADYLEVLAGLTAVYRDQRRLKEADAAMALALKSLGPGTEETASIFKLGLAEIYESLSRYAPAAAIYGDVLATIERLQGQGPGYRHVLAARGRALAGLGRDIEAEADLTRALTLMERDKEDGYPAQHARALNDYGRLLFRLGHHGEAVATFEKAETLMDRIGLLRQPGGLAAARDFARAYARQGMRDSATSVLRRALRIHIAPNDRTASRGTIDQRERREHVREMFLELTRLLTSAPVSPGRVAEAFEIAQRARLFAAPPISWRNAARSVEEEAALGRLMDARDQTVAARRRIERRLMSPEAGSGRVAPRVLREGFKELRALERKIAAQNETLQSQFPRAAAVLAPIPLESTAARRLLRRDEAIVTTMTDRRLTHVWILTPKTAHYHRAALGTTDITAIVERLRASLDPRRRAVDGALQPYPLDLAARLYGHLFAPARVALEGVSHVFHAPDGALRDLPLSVLVADLARSRDDGEIGPEMEIDQGSSGSIPDTGANTEFAAYREVVWFIDKYSHSRLPSPISLRNLRANARTSGASENFVGIGDPALSDRSKLGELRLPARSGVTLRDIVGGLGAGEKKLFLGPRARESVLGSMRLKRYRTIAFATPGAVAGKPPGRTEPALILSTPDTTREKADGVLTASEIARLDLDADLVVLDVPAPEGESGTAWLSELAQAFLRAGARSVMVSRWPVERQAAISFTKGVLEKRNGDGPHVLAGLLQRSALEILNDETRPARFAHPTHWGAFSIIGDGGQRY